MSCNGIYIGWKKKIEWLKLTFYEITDKIMWVSWGVIFEGLGIDMTPEALQAKTVGIPFLECILKISHILSFSVKNKFFYAFNQEFPYRINHVLECEFYLLEMMVSHERCSIYIYNNHCKYLFDACCAELGSTHIFHLSRWERCPKNNPYAAGD